MRQVPLDVVDAGRGERLQPNLALAVSLPSRLDLRRLLSGSPCAGGLLLLSRVARQTVVPRFFGPSLAERQQGLA